MAESKKCVLILLADGFEEIEALASADILKRLGAEVTLASIREKAVTSSAGTVVLADTLLEEIKDPASFDALVFPGGLPGATNLRDDVLTHEILIQMNEKNRIIAAICASPAAVLGSSGILCGKKITGYPTTESLSLKDAVSLTGDRAIQDGNIVTGKGPGATFDFAFLLGKALGIGDETISSVKEKMFVAL